MAAEEDIPLLSRPHEAPSGCPLGLEYLAQLDQILVQQQKDTMEGT